jgi:hypothetical protein
VFPILLDLRAYYRKRARLPGRYTKLATALSGSVLMTNRSFTGVGDVIELRFCLDDPQESSLCKRAVVKHVRSRAIGATFCHLNAYEAALGLYLIHPAVALDW